MPHQLRCHVQLVVFSLAGFATHICTRMFTFCVDQVSKMEYKPDEDDRRWLEKREEAEKADGRPKKQSSPALLEQHSARAEGRQSTHFFGRTKKVSAPPSSQIEAFLAAAVHLKEEERRRKRSAVHLPTSYSHNPQPHDSQQHNFQPHLLHPHYQPSHQPSSSPHTSHPPQSHPKQHQQSTYHHPFSRSPLYQLHSPQQPTSNPTQPQSSSRPNPPMKHSEGRRAVEPVGAVVAEKCKPLSKSDALGAQMDAALEAVARRRREAIGSKVAGPSGRGGKAECG